MYILTNVTTRCQFYPLGNVLATGRRASMSILSAHPKRMYSTYQALVERNRRYIPNVSTIASCGRCLLKRLAWGGLIFPSICVPKISLFCICILGRRGVLVWRACKHFRVFQLGCFRKVHVCRKLPVSRLNK